MSWTLKLDKFMNDLVPVSNGDGTFKFATVTGSDEVRQRVKVALMHYKEEYFLNIPSGIPWYSKILGTKGSYSYLSNLLRKAILQVPGVIRIITFDLKYVGSSRSYSITTQILVERSSGETPDITTVDGIYMEI